MKKLDSRSKLFSIFILLCTAGVHQLCYCPTSSKELNTEGGHLTNIKDCCIENKLKVNTGSFDCAIGCFFGYDYCLQLMMLRDSPQNCKFFENGKRNNQFTLRTCAIVRGANRDHYYHVHPMNASYLHVKANSGKCCPNGWFQKLRENDLSKYQECYCTFKREVTDKELTDNCIDGENQTTLLNLTKNLFKSEILFNSNEHRSIKRFFNITINYSTSIEAQFTLKNFCPTEKAEKEGNDVDGEMDPTEIDSNTETSSAKDPIKIDENTKTTSAKDPIKINENTETTSPKDPIEIDSNTEMTSAKDPIKIDSNNKTTSAKDDQVDKVVSENQQAHSDAGTAKNRDTTKSDKANNSDKNLFIAFSVSAGVAVIVIVGGIAIYWRTKPKNGNKEKNLYLEVTVDDQVVSN